MSPIPPDKRRKVEFFYLETACPLHLLTHTEYSNVTFGQTKLRTSNKRVLRDPGLFHAVGDLVKKKGVSRTAVLSQLQTQIILCISVGYTHGHEEEPA